MKNKQVLKRLVSGILAAAVTATSIVVPTTADDSIDLADLSSKGISVVSPNRDKLVEEDLGYADEDEVRVSIVLEDASTIKAGFDIETIAVDSKAVAYRDSLKVKQLDMTKNIEKATKEELDVVHNLTLAANLISANVKYGQIKDIEKVSGVKSVLVETKYDPAKTVETDTDKPNMSTSSSQIGSTAAWSQGYTGAGSIVAVIDTGIDSDHQSFDADAFMYSLKQNAKLLGKSVDEYIKSLDLLDAAKVEAVADQLNVKIDPSLTYLSSKIPFAYNYIDGDYDITHDNDAAGGHGSHVEGIAAANRYIVNEYGEYYTALSSTFVQGVAPDAQIITMKVFGKGGGAYDSDYMLAIEDAIVLGADSINLSLGSANGGTSKNTNAEYQQILDDLSDSGAVVAISAGNAGHWADSAYTGGYLYADDVNTQTNGSPGSFTNAFTVASVENVGSFGSYFTVGGMPIVFDESTVGNSGEAYTNKPFASLTGDSDSADIEYVFIDGLGTPEDWEAVGDDLEGKIAVCSRGSLSFIDKCENAVAAGAIATIIYNNVPGVIHMDLSDYTQTAPAITVTQYVGEILKNMAEPSENGEYYTGTLNVNNNPPTVGITADQSYMSDYSSWGVPGSLELKPEITAPGGNIYSVDGEWEETDQYVSMSGTSMASPQVAGMAAVAAQYIREKDLAKKTNLSARILIQSLLMSTAEPLFDEYGDYYPVFQQGAGLANIGSLINADSYILMDKDANAGAADGKVKVELGDDPDKKGVYSFGFTLYNLTSSEKKFDLSADFFTQNVVSDDYDDLYMDRATALLNGTTKFDCGNTAVVPANGSKHVTVTFTLADETDWDSFTLGKDFLDAYFTSGAYIEGFVYAEDEGDGQTLTTDHSIPVLGFYGNWSTASMFDKGSYEDYYLSGEEGRLPYLVTAYDYNPYAALQANAFGVSYDGDGPYPLGGNPYLDEYYDPDRNAVNSETTLLSMVQFAAIRNAADSKFFVYNETTKKYLADESLGAVTGAYYHDNAGRWYSYSSSFKPNYDFSGAAEGDKLTLGFALAPEYYLDAEGNVRWEDVDMTNALTMNVTIDNTAPVIVSDPEVKDGVLTVTVKDNQHIAAVLLTNKSGSKIYAYAGSDSNAKAGENYKVEIDVSEVNADSLYLRVCDYAMNTVSTEIDQKFGEGTILPGQIAFNIDYGFNYWVSFEGTSATEYDVSQKYEGSDYAFNAATIVDHIVYAIDENGMLVVMPDSDLADTQEVINFNHFFDEKIVPLDMAYNAKDDKIYVLIAAAMGLDLSAQRYLVAFDKLECVPELVGEVPLETLTLACDEDGNFYSAECGTTCIYKYTLDAVTGDGKTELVIDLAEELGEEDFAAGYLSLQSMEWDTNKNVLGWAIYTDWIDSYYFEIDPATKEFDFSEPLWYQLCALIIPDLSTPSKTPDWAKPTEATKLFVSAEESAMYIGNTQKVTASFLPWTAENCELTWESDDENILTVDSRGNVKAVGEGTARIYAYLKSDDSVFDYVDITVERAQVVLTGTLQDVGGDPLMYTWNMSKDLTWTATNELKSSMTSATVNKLNGHIYMLDGSDAAIHELDPVDGTELNLYPFGLSQYGASLWDMAYSDMYSAEDRFSVYGIYGSLLLIDYDPTSNEEPKGYDASWDLMLITGAEYFVAVANLGECTLLPEPEEGEDGGIAPYAEETVVGERVAALDNLNNLWIFEIYNMYDEEEDEASIDLYEYVSNAPALNETYPLVEDYGISASMVLGDDGYLYLSAANGDTNVLYQLDVEITDVVTDIESYRDVDYTARKLGEAGDGVWPMLITSAESTLVTETDEETGITVTYTFIAEGVHLSVKTLDSSDTTVSYDIELVDADGENVDPDGKVVVEIPVPEGMTAENAAVYVLNEDGTYTKVEAELVDGVFVFTTYKLGVYAVSTEELDKVETPVTTPEETTPEETTNNTNDPDDNKPTGIAIAIVPAVVSAAAVMVTKRRNRK